MAAETPAGPPRLAADGLDAPLRDPALRADRRRLHAVLVGALERYCALHSAEEIYRAGQAAGFPWAPCRTPGVDAAEVRRLHAANVVRVAESRPSSFRWRCIASVPRPLDDAPGGHVWGVCRGRLQRSL